MTDRTSLLTLADRVEALKGPDREVDALVYQALYPDRPVMVFGGDVRTNVPPRYQPAREIDIASFRDGEAIAGFLDAARVTASVDAVIALIEDKLPASAEGDTAFNPASAMVRIGDADFYSWRAATPALALLAAALRAIASQEGE